MSHDMGHPNGRFCISDERCRQYDYVAHPTHAAEVTDPDLFCGACLTGHEQDINRLLWDYVDLEQLQLPTLSQALDTERRGSAGPPMPLRGEPEALQAEIHHVLTAWEYELRTAQGLSEPAAHPRAGVNVQRAHTILVPRVRALSLLPAVTMYRTGCEDDPEDIPGWEAVQHLSRLHQRARAMLGRTRRTFWVPGDCAQCGTRENAAGFEDGGPLYRGEPQQERHEPPVWCAACGEWRTYDDYQRYLRQLVWPLRYRNEQAAVAA